MVDLVRSWVSASSSERTGELSTPEYVIFFVCCFFSYIFQDLTIIWRSLYAISSVCMQRGTVLDLNVAGEVLSRCVHESNETKIEVRNHLDFTHSLSLSLQADGVTNISQGKTDIESETDQEVEAKKTANKVYWKVIEEDLNLEPLCDEVIN